MSDRTRVRELYESGLWIAEISKAAWHELRARHRHEDQGLDVRSAEIARLEHEQRVELRRGRRCFPQVFAHEETLSIEMEMRSDRTLGELLGIT